MIFKSRKIRKGSLCLSESATKFLFWKEMHRLAIVFGFSNTIKSFQELNISNIVVHSNVDNK